MSMTITEKILARVYGKRVTVGEFVRVKPDLVMSYQGITHFPAICKEPIGVSPGLREVGVEKIRIPEKSVIFLNDHMYPPTTIEEAENQRRMRQAVKEQGIRYVYYAKGVSHQVFAESGLVRPGMLITAEDPHINLLGALGAYTPRPILPDIYVYITGETLLKVPANVKVNLIGELPEGVMARDIWHHILSDIGPDGAADSVLDFTGSVIEALSIDERMTICSLVMFSGAESAIINPDQKTLQYLKQRTAEPLKTIKSDPGAEYTDVLEFDVSKLEPLVAAPPMVNNIKPISELEGIEIDQASIGTCAGGRLEDLRVAAKILRNKKLSPEIRMLISPASREIYLKAIREGLIPVFIRAGAIVIHPTCDICYGRIGTLLPGEKCISTATLNQPGRMGSSEGEIYLASPATVAASAVEGRIADPRKCM